MVARPNLAELADHLHHRDEYDVLYREWSALTHASDLVRQIITAPGTLSLRRLRETELFNEVVVFAVNFAVRGTKAVLVYYRPLEEPAWREWYKREVQGLLARF